MTAADLAAPDGSLAALRQLRRTRQLHRLGSLDWFEVAYRVYIFGILGGGAILLISDSVKDATVTGDALLNVADHGPAALGLVAALAVLLGLRGGVNGGPLALEAADVAHVMLAPIDRRQALARPAVQRLRAVVFAGAGAGAIAGQLAGRRLPGSILAWLASGALYGAAVALWWLAAALLAHTLRVPRWAATVVGLALVAWQTGALVRGVPGPATTLGDLAFWGWRQDAVDLVGLLLAAALVTVGMTLLRRISLEALARRSSLVAQLRFAVTMQDLRTVILLRRQLNQERTRSTPWRRLRPSARRSPLHTVWRRGWHGLLRFPTGRLLRMAALAAALGYAEAAVVKGTTTAVLVAALVAFVLGLEVMEPLSQEVDQADLADGLPVDRGALMARHLVAPAVALVPFAAIAGAVAVLTLGTDALVPVAILAVPTVVAGTAGSVVSVVRDAPDPTSQPSQEVFMPPEMAGFTTTLRTIWPLLVSLLGVSVVLLPRAAWRAGDSVDAAAVRAAVGAVLFVALVRYWVKVRDHVRRRIRAFMNEGREYTAAQRSSRSETS